MNSVTETDATPEDPSWECEVLRSRGSDFTSTLVPAISLLMSWFLRMEGWPPVVPREYFVFLGEEMSMYCGSPGRVVPRACVFFGDWWAGGAALMIALWRIEGSSWPEMGSVR